MKHKTITFLLATLALLMTKRLCWKHKQQNGLHWSSASRL